MLFKGQKLLHLNSDLLHWIHRSTASDLITSLVQEATIWLERGKGSILRVSTGFVQ